MQNNVISWLNARYKTPVYIPKSPQILTIPERQQIIPHARLSDSKIHLIVSSIARPSSNDPFLFVLSIEPPNTDDAGVEDELPRSFNNSMNNDEDENELQDASDCILPFLPCRIMGGEERVWGYLSQVIGIHPSSSRRSSSEQSDSAEILRESSLPRYGSMGISNGG